MANTSVIAAEDRRVHRHQPASPPQPYSNNLEVNNHNGFPEHRSRYQQQEQQKKVHAFRQLAPPTCDLAVVACDFAGKTLALARACGSVEFWFLSHDAPFLAGRVTLPVAVYPKITCIKFYNKRRLFVSGGSGFLLELSPLRCTIIRAVQCHIGSVNTLSVCSKTGKVVVGSETGAISIFNALSANNEIPDDDLRFDMLLVQLSQPVICVTIRDRIVAAGGKGKIWIWYIPPLPDATSRNHSVTPRLLHEINASTAGEARCTILSIAFADENTLVTGDSKGGTCFWDIRAGVLRNGVYAHQEAVTCVQPMQFPSADGKTSGEPCVFSSGIHPFLVEFRRAHASVLPPEQLMAYDSLSAFDHPSLSAKWVRTLKLKSVQTRHVRCLTQANEYLVAAGEGATVTLSNSKLLIKLQPLTSPRAVHFAFDTKLTSSSADSSATGVSPQYCYIMGCDSEMLSIWRFRTLLSTTTTTLAQSDRLLDDGNHSGPLSFITHSELLVVPPEDDSSMSNSSYATTTTSHSTTNSTTSNTMLTISSSNAPHHHMNGHKHRDHQNSTLTCEKLLEYKIRSKNGPITSTALSDDASFVAFADCKLLKVFKLNVIDENVNNTASGNEYSEPKRTKSSSTGGNGPEVYLTPIQFEQSTAKRLVGSTAMCFTAPLNAKSVISLPNNTAKSTRSEISGLIVAEKTGSLVWLRLRPNPVDADTVTASIIWCSATMPHENGVKTDTDDSDAANVPLDTKQLAGVREVAITNDRTFIAALTFESRLLVFEFDAAKLSGKIAEVARWEKRQKADPFVTFCLVTMPSDSAHYAFIACASQQISMLDLRSRNIMLFFDAGLYDGLYEYISPSFDHEMMKRRNDKYSCIRNIDCRSGKRLAWSTSEKIYMVDVNWQALARRGRKRAAEENDDGDETEEEEEQNTTETKNLNLWSNVQVIDSYKHVVSFQELAVPAAFSTTNLLTNGGGPREDEHDSNSSSSSSCQFVLVEQTPSDIEAHLPSVYRLKKFGF